MTKKIDLLRALSAITDIHHMEMSSAVKNHVMQAIKALISELSKECGEDEPEVVKEVAEEPKKRGRKKKEPEVVVPAENTPDGVPWVKYDTEEQAVADAAGVPVEEVVNAWETNTFEILPPDGEHGLDKRIGRLSTLNGLSTETCVKLGASPLLVANTVGKTGKHPFFKGAIAYISYLPRERQKHYMANALAYDGYKSFSDFCDIDEQRKDWEEMGIDMDFVSTILTDDETPNLRPASKVVNEDGVVEKIKLAGGFKKITEVLGSDGEELVKFMARYGINNQLLVDILTIVKKHNDDPNEALLPF